MDGYTTSHVTNQNNDFLVSHGSGDGLGVHVTLWGITQRTRRTRKMHITTQGAGRYWLIAGSSAVAVRQEFGSLCGPLYMTVGLQTKSEAAHRSFSPYNIF